MILQLTPDTGKRTYEHETVYVVGNRKALESYDKLSKVCKCVQSIYNAKRVQIKCIVKRRKSTHKRSGSEKPHNISAEENPKVPANEGDDGSRHTLLEMPQIASESTSEMGTQTRNLFKTMKKRNVSTYINELCKLEQREQFTRPVSYLYCA